MTVLYRPGLCEKCARCRQNENFCVRERCHTIIRRRSEIIRGVIIYGPYPNACELFTPRREVVE